MGAEAKPLTENRIDLPHEGSPDLRCTVGNSGPVLNAGARSTRRQLGEGTRTHLEIVRNVIESGLLEDAARTRTGPGTSE